MTRSSSQALTKAVRLFTWLEQFGHDCPKPTLLYSTAPSLGALKQQSRVRMKKNVKTRKRLARVVVHENGKKAITGGREALKESHMYPVRFALELVKLINPDAST